MSLLLGSCVSVKLPGGKVTSAKDVTFTAPPSPFQEIKADSSDKAWLSGKTGNTISFLSECGGGADPSLEQLEVDSLGAINKVKVLQSDETMFNGRAARQSTAQGQIDGVSVQMALLVFKKNGCNYTLSYGGVAKQFSVEEDVFEKFKQSFKAP
ncbi:hypothetical protein QJS83_00795 [Bdellovibrio sp. 22V]|nr:hypothetical protein [Bdellovibrio sp. 22V]WII72403.1 hypothetical protein QJS83_00795 [Bdellovibrio sp. 22V]